MGAPKWKAFGFDLLTGTNEWAYVENTGSLEPASDAWTWRAGTKHRDAEGSARTAVAAKAAALKALAAMRRGGRRVETASPPKAR